MTHEQMDQLKVGQIIYSNKGAHSVIIRKIPNILTFGMQYTIEDIHGCEHRESYRYIKNNFEINPIMTKEKAKHLSEVLKAYSEGKDIQMKTMGGEWIDCIKGKEVMAILFPDDLRIKPEKEFKPYKSALEFLRAQKKHGPYLINNARQFLNPVFVDDSGVVLADSVGNTYKDYSYIGKHYKWADGALCTVLE